MIHWNGIIHTNSDTIITFLLCLYDCPCTFTHTVCTEGEVRLVNGIIANSQRGLVQFCHNNEWGTVCNDGFGNNANAASVVCNQLGFNRFG